MTVFTDIKTLKGKIRAPLILTIGMFDGVHLGHQQVLKTAKIIAKKKHTKLFCITFVNNPKSVLHPDRKISSIYPVEKKIELLKGCGVDYILLESFTLRLANQTSYEFLNNIHQNIPFSDLVLGYNATLGRDQANNREQVIAAGKKLDIHVHYVDKVFLNDHTVSSSHIRHLLAEGHIHEAEKFLGRNYNP